MVRKDTFKDKPKPPTREQIIADLTSADKSDILFKQPFEDFTVANEEVSNNSDTAHGVNNGQRETVDKVKVKQTYEQVTKLIQLHTQLADEPKYLDEKYEHLEKLGQDVSDSILDLKSAAETIVKKAKNK